MAVKTRKKKQTYSVTYSVDNAADLDKECKSQIDASKADNPLQGRINDLVAEINKQVLDFNPKKKEEGFTSTQLKEVTSARATLKALKFKSEALKSKITRSLINAGLKLEAEDRPHSWYILKEMVDSENKSTITKRRKTSAKSVKLTTEIRNEITEAMQKVDRFTITDSASKEATLAFNKIGGLDYKFSRSQLESVVNTEIKNGRIKKAKDKEGKAQIYEKKKKR